MLLTELVIRDNLPVTGDCQGVYGNSPSMDASENGMG